MATLEEAIIGNSSAPQDSKIDSSKLKEYLANIVGGSVDLPTLAALRVPVPVEIELTNAQIKSGNSVPIPITNTAPGDGKYVSVLGASASVRNGGTPWSAPFTATIVYIGGEDNLLNGEITIARSTNAVQFVSSASLSPIPSADVDNVGLGVLMTDDVVDAGDGTAILTVFYCINNI